MKKLLAALLLSVASMCSGPVGAQSYVDSKDMEWIWQDKGGYILLSNKPCTDPTVLKNIYPQYHADFRAGELASEGNPTAPLCYDATDMQGGQVYIVGRAGEVYLPMQLFTLRSRT